MWAINIQWDVDEQEDLEYLPNKIELPTNIAIDDVPDYLSDVTGYCHKGYEIEY